MARHAHLWQEFRKTHSERLKSELFLAYYDWALGVARSIPFHLELGALERSDVAGVTAEALLDVLERFDPDRGVDFEGFARKRVRGAVINAINVELRHTRPRPKPGAKLSDDAFIEAAIAVEGLVVEVLFEQYVSEQADAPDHLLFRDTELKAVMEHGLATLTKREFEVIRTHFFLDIPKAEVAATLGISKGRVSQLLAAAYAKLRAAILASSGADAFW